MYSIYDTREPEGNGGPVLDEHGNPLAFITHEEAVVAAKNRFGEHDVLRVIIAGSPQDDNEWYCDMDLSGNRGVCNTRVGFDGDVCSNTAQHAAQGPIARRRARRA